MRRFLNWVAGVPIAIIVIGFAVANRQWVAISFDPFTQQSPWASIDLPLWALLFCGILIGVIAGWIACWLAQGKWRRAAKEARVELRQAQDETERLKHDPRLAAPPSPDLA